MNNSDYINGYLEPKGQEGLVGTLTVEGIDLSPIQGVLFNEDGVNYLWLRRADILEYDNATQKFIKRPRKPYFQAYLKKQVNDNTVAYKGEFPFMRYRFTIIATWDNVFGMEKGRLNFFVERLPEERQDLLKIKKG